MAAHEQGQIDNLDLTQEIVAREQTRARSLGTDIEAVDVGEGDKESGEDKVSKGNGNDGINFEQLKEAAAQDEAARRRRRRDVDAVEFPVDEAAGEETARNAEIVAEADQQFPDVQGVSFAHCT